MNRFNDAALHTKKRARFKGLSHNNTLDLNVGDLVPIMDLEVIPGDTHAITTNLFARLTTPLVPVMDNLILDYFYFFVPNRLVYDEWQNLMGEEKSAWLDQQDYEGPHYVPGNRSYVPFPKGSIADYYGIPDLGEEPAYPKIPINTYLPRGYKLIWNEWFRDQNLQDPMVEHVAGGDSVGVLDWQDDEGNALMPLKANKLHDYFTSVLPSPQKGPSVFIPFEDIPITSNQNEIPEELKISQSNIKLRDKASSNTSGPKNLIFRQTNDYDGFLAYDNNSHNTGQDIKGNLSFTNLWAKAEEYGAPTINALRFALRVQEIYELNARGGSRYVEMLYNHFGVVSPDARLQRPEFLGGGREYVGMQQVVNTAEATGATGAFSVTRHSKYNFTKSFTEHGYIHCLAVVRYKHTYSQGIPKHFTRIDTLDHYVPLLATLGEQPVYTWEIFADETEGKFVFGYQEAWADLKYKPNRLTGSMRTNVPDSLDVWHYGDKYLSRPYLSANWIQEDKSNVDRSLTISSDTTKQMILNCSFDITTDRIIPLFSVPNITGRW